MNVNLRDEDGRTALHRTKGDVSELISMGADVNVTDEGGWTPLMCAASSGDLLKVKLILSVDNIEVNAVNDAGCTALHYACSKGHVEIVKALLDREGISLNIQEIHSKTTPLLRSILSSQLRVAKMLIAAGARCNLKDIEGNTALHYAFASENVELAIDLINAGALDNIKNNMNQSPIEIASEFMKNRLEEEL